MASPATATQTNPNWRQMQEVTAKLRQTEKQAERIKDNLRQLNSAWAARPQMHRPREEQLDVVSSQVERKARDLSDWPRLLKKESGIRRRISACLGPSCRGLQLCGNGFGTSASPPSRDEGALQDKPPLRLSQLEALAVPAGLKQTENSSLASTSTGIVSPPELPEEPCLERHTCAVDEAHEVPQLIHVRADRQDVRDTPRHQDTLTTLPEHLPRDLTQKYKFIDAHSLGSGAVARVCRMQELETGRHVAVKVVEKYPLQIRNMITQMEREIRVHKRLRHPNILRLHACFEDSTHWYMVLELASRLVNLLVRHPWKRLREPQAGWLFGQVVDGVSHLHLQGCVHRDLKPDNVLIVEDCPKICDFGWCAELNEGQRRTFCGTFDYMAPEVIFGEGHGAEADVWSLGITLYELLAGGTPFASQSAAGGRTAASETFQERIHKVDYVFPNWFSSEVCHLVNGMLQRYPHQRYTASKVLEHKWLATFFLKPKQALEPWFWLGTESKDSGWRTAAKPRADTGAALARVSLCNFYFGSTLTVGRVLVRRARKGIGRPACLMTSLRSPANFPWPWAMAVQARINLRRMPLILVLCGVLQPRPVPTQMWPVRIRDPCTGSPQCVLAFAEQQLVAKVSAAVPPHAGLCESEEVSNSASREPSELLSPGLPKSLSRPELGIHPGACRTHALSSRNFQRETQHRLVQSLPKAHYEIRAENSVRHGRQAT
ncbi:unnamed protein product [Symbiodinium sp. CCMP2592]|nr:unnamed protein product [Symbiodinium sp. CCMP2592]